MFYQKSGIYKITNIINNKCYIGSSINVSCRISSHKNNLKRNKHCNNYLQFSYNKYSITNFLFEVVEYCDENLLLKKEEFYINFYKSNNKQYGYNLENFEKGRKKHSQESKDKISKSNKGKRKGMRPSQIAIDKFTNASKLKKSEEHKNKIRIAHLGKKRKPFSEEWKNKMSISSKKTKYWNIYDLENNKIIENKTTKYVANFFNVTKALIGQCFKKNYKLLKKYKIEQIINNIENKQQLKLF